MPEAFDINPKALDCLVLLLILGGLLLQLLADDRQGFGHLCEGDGLTPGEADEGGADGESSSGERNEETRQSLLQHRVVWRGRHGSSLPAGLQRIGL